MRELGAAIARKLRKAPAMLKGYGLPFSLRLVASQLQPPFFKRVVTACTRVNKKLVNLKRSRFVDDEIRRLEDKREEILAAREGQCGTPLEDLGLSPANLVKLRSQGNGAIIAEIDQDGYWLSRYGPIQNAPTVDEHAFLPRRKTTLFVVAKNDFVGIRKDYRGEKLSFVNEVNALHELSRAGCRVPAILDIDFRNLSLTMSMILGEVLREELAKKGAAIRDRDQPSAVCNTRENIERGKRVLYQVIDSSFASMVFEEISKAHRAGVVWNDIKYGNIIIEHHTRRPFLIDFEHAFFCRDTTSKYSRVLRDQDIEKFNLHFKQTRNTYQTLAAKINAKSYPYPDSWYAPVYFGDGLRIGSVWSPDVGYGRWHYILKHHLPQAARILDLGANNGANALYMLRNGAQEVIAVERDKRYIAQGKFLKEAFEWFDNREYNLRYLHSDMTEIVRRNLGGFDLVTALCSIYYLQDEDIARLVRTISKMCAVFVIQANVDRALDRRKEGEDIFRKASVEYLSGALKNHGFPRVTVISPKGYSRPLIIGRT